MVVDFRYRPLLPANGSNDETVLQDTKIMKLKSKITPIYKSMKSLLDVLKLFELPAAHLLNHHPRAHQYLKTATMLLNLICLALFKWSNSSF